MVTVREGQSGANGESSTSIYTLLLLLSRFSRVQLCATPLDGSPPGSSVPGILQARTLEWVAIAFSNAWKWKVKVKSFSHVRLIATPWTAAHQAPPSMGFSRQEHWSGAPWSSPYIHYHVYNNSWWEVVWHREPSLVLWDKLRWGRAREEGGSGWRWNMHNYGWFVLYGRNDHNVVKQFSFN